MHTSGPLFDGRADTASDALCADLERAVAQRGVSLVRTNLDHVLKHQTGHYRAEISIERTSRTRVTDGGIVYGPWLEGTSSRNRSTRFKGYATFRRTAAELAKIPDDLLDRVLTAHVEAMNR
jgi:hypothetical protein